MIPRGLARRIDRLSRRAHAFHRFAHHPLCDRYAGELVAVGRRTRICRGCALGLAGAVVGAVAGALAGAGAAGLWGLLALAVPLAPGRPPKLLSRFLPACAGTFAAASSPFGLVAVALAVAAALRWRARGPDRTPCLSCPERELPEACAGFAPIVRREGAFRRLAGRWLRPPLGAA